MKKPPRRSLKAKDVRKRRGTRALSRPRSKAKVRAAGARGAQSPGRRAPISPPAGEPELAPWTPSLGTWWEVPATLLRTLTETSLKLLMEELLRAQAVRVGMSASEVTVNAEDKAADEGADAFTGPPSTADEWLGDSDTCWQFKAGNAGRPSKMAAEIKKPKPLETLKNGGRFVVVASASASGRSGRDARLKPLKAAARALRLRKPKLDVLTSESLAIWLNQHVPLAARTRKLPFGWRTIEDWQADEVHSAGWIPTETQRQSLAQVRATLAGSGSVHVHVWGPPGVGKTRFALEVCKNPDWRSSALYVPQFAAETRALIEQLCRGAALPTIIALDEVPSANLASLNEIVRLGNGRVKLITIGYQESTDLSQIPQVRIDPLTLAEVVSVVRGWHEEMPREHVDFVARFSAGFVRLARLAARAVSDDPTIDTQGLFERGDIRHLLDSMLGNEFSRRALHVVAALSSVGWRGQRAIEGEAIARHFGLSWPEVQAAVVDFDRRFAIAPAAGDLRFISPLPLGNYLALEAWRVNDALMRSLPAALPTDAARDAYNDRLMELARAPVARPFSQEELQRMIRWSHFRDRDAVNRWSALMLADVSLSAANVRSALEGASHEERLEIAGDARRTLVNALVTLAWPRSSAADALLALATLAEAENEIWANNATGELAEKFQLHLGGTALPFGERLEVARELISRGGGYLSLMVEALASVGGRHESRLEPAFPTTFVRELEWRPMTTGDMHEALLATIAVLEIAAKHAESQHDSVFTNAIPQLVQHLSDDLLRPATGQLLGVISNRRPALKPVIEREIRQFLARDAKYAKELDEDQIAEIARLAEAFADTSPAAIVRRITEQNDWDDELEPIETAAQALIADENLLLELSSWLLSGKASRAWELGTALAVQGLSEASIGRLLDRVGGPDVRLVTGFVCQKKAMEGDRWFDSWLARQLAEPDRMPLVVDAVLRCKPDRAGIDLLVGCLERGHVEDVLLPRFRYAAWNQEVSTKDLRSLLDALARIPAGRPVALQMIHDWVRKGRPQIPDDLLADLLSDPASLTGDDASQGHYWTTLAERFIPNSTRLVVRTILKAVQMRGRRRLLLEHHPAREVLSKAVDADPASVWSEIRPILEDKSSTSLFAIGFPQGVVDRLPREALLRWAAEHPPDRPAILVRMSNKQIGPDTLLYQLLDKFGALREVAAEAFRHFVSGVWSGPASTHWERIAVDLESRARGLPSRPVRVWAKQTAQSLRRMADKERHREEEEKVRR